jgi:cleavage and polyadenylation specificity factor subunit 3
MSSTPFPASRPSEPVKRPPPASLDRDYLEITPLGAGAEVGRSCHILRYKGKTIMLDCGLHPGYTGIASLPFFDEIDPKEIDLILISHFHLDHAAALPYFLLKTDFRGEVYMTHPTKSIYKLILQDYVKVSTISVEETLYDEKDLLASMDRIKVVNYHQIVQYKGIKFWCYNAGHVLGAAMFMIEIAGVHILYTGDYSRREDRHLMSAETPEIKPDVLIIEATYGVHTLPPVQERENIFTGLVQEIVTERRGKCLLPVFALGRAQEVLLILDEYWESNPTLHGIPIYYASALAKKCMNVYQTYLNMMNAHIQQKAQFANPFMFKHILNLKGMEQYEDNGQPCVIMASPGMLQNGLARELLELWAPDPANGVIITGYSVQGTMAQQILTNPTHIQAMNGAKIPLNCSVSYVSFSAHADYAETSEFVDILRPPHVILVHGEAVEGVGRLKEALKARYRDSMNVMGPKNCQTVQIEFRQQKIARTVGKLAESAVDQSHRPVDGAPLTGLIVRQNFNYQFLSTDQLSDFTPLQSSTVQQDIKVPFHQTFESLKYFISQLFPVEEIQMNKQENSDKTSKMEETPAVEKKTDGEMELGRKLLVSESIALTHCTSYVALTWSSNPVADLIADSVIALIINLQTNPHAMKVMGSGKCKHEHHKHTHETVKQEEENNKQEESSLSIQLSIPEAESVLTVSKQEMDSIAFKDQSRTLTWALQQYFDIVEEDELEGSWTIRDGKSLQLANEEMKQKEQPMMAKIYRSSWKVEAEEKTVRSTIEAIIERAKQAVEPIR